MRRFRPLHGVILVVLFVVGMVGVQLAVEARHQDRFERVSPGPDGQVRISLEGLGPRQVRFFRYRSNPGNQEVRFFVGRDGKGEVQVAFDASETCAKGQRGFRPQGDWVVCNKCDKSFRLADVNGGGGGCMPIPLPHRVDGSELAIAEAEILKGWRLFT